MPRTASTIDGTPDYATLSVTMIDDSGDQRTVSNRIAVDADAADIEAYVAALAAATNASIFRVEVGQAYVGAESPSDALSDMKSASVYDNVVALWSDVTAGRTDNTFVPAPKIALFTGDTDNPSITALSALNAAFAAIVFGTPALKSLRYTERREINTRIKV